MDPLSLIVAALVAGASAGAKDVVAGGVKDAYQALRSLLTRKLGTHEAATAGISPDALLEAHARDVDTWQGPLTAAIIAAGADRDEEVLAAAKALLERTDPEGSVHGKYTVDARGAQGVQIGDHGTMTVNVTPSNTTGSGKG
jgi:RIP homotypic interaction motif